MPRMSSARRVASLIGLAAATALTVPSVALAGCPAQQTYKAFAAYGDDADYFLAPGGNFESGTTGWTLTNSKVVSGNALLGTVSTLLGGVSSVSLGSGLLPANATLTSPAFCVDQSHPYFRYMLKANGTPGQLTTYLQYTTATGGTALTEVKSATDTALTPSQWKPSDLQPLAVNIPLVQNAGTTASVRLVFKSSMALLGQGYQVDDILIDPYRRG